jgi:hypothetical protein
VVATIYLSPVLVLVLVLEIDCEHEHRFTEHEHEFWRGASSSNGTSNPQNPGIRALDKIGKPNQFQKNLAKFLRKFGVTSLHL